MVDAQYFGDGLTYVNPGDLKGKLIAIEGTDGVGRSTHIELLQEWLEVQGYGVITTGWTRSNLMSQTIEMAKAGNILDRWSLSLLYATDFADRLEHQIIPALRSGFIVLADRYIYTAFARDFVRSGGDRQWIRDVFGFALVPDLICYLRIDVETLTLRVIETKGMNFWESGMDLRLGTDLYDSFKKYQSLLIKEFDRMADEIQFEVIDARNPPEDIQQELRARIKPLLTSQSVSSRQLASRGL
jgi:dTMP kinase